MEEGIMGLPQGQTPTPYSSADAYEAALAASSMIDPTAAPAVRQALRESVADIYMPPEQLDVMIDLVEGLFEDPTSYPQTRARIIESGLLTEEDLPETFDPEFFGTMLLALNEAKLMQAEGAMAPMEAGPEMSSLPPMGMAKGGLADVAQYLASRGRGGDTMLAHITPEEAALLKRYGGSGTLNPETGLPEFNWISDRWKDFTGSVKKVLNTTVGRVVATIALAAFLGPAGMQFMSTAAAAGVASSAITLAAGGNLRDALISGALGYFGGGGSIGGFSPTTAISGYLPAGLPGALKTGLSTAAVGTGLGLVAGMKPKDALKMGATAGVGSGLMTAGKEFLGNVGEVNQQQPSPVGQAGTVEPPGSAQPPGPPPPIESVGTAAEIVNRPGLQVQTGPAPALENFTESATEGSAPIRTYTGGTANFVPTAQSPGASATAPTDFLGRTVQTATNFYNEYISPDRPSVGPNTSALTRYGPLAAAGLGVTALAGGFKAPPPDTRAADEARAYRQDMQARAKARQDELDRLGYGFDKGIAAPERPTLVPTPSYGSIPAVNAVGPVPMYTPTGITAQPQGIPQPYNVAGLYNIPEPYQPPRMAAKGGEMTKFPRRTGPIDGPGTGTSDSIPAMLSDGEFVFTAKAVRNAGGGSRRKGAARMFKLMKMLEGGPVGRNN